MSPDPGDAGRPIRVGMLAGSLTRSGGGVAESVLAAAEALRAIDGFEVELFCLDMDEPAIETGGPPPRLFRPAGPAAFGYAPGLSAALAGADLDVLHVHGIWMYMSVAARQWKAQSGRRYVVSPHGMLDPWALANSGWKKRLAGILYERGSLRSADCLHALCEAELASIRDFGLRNAVCIVPNGVAPAAAADARLPPWRRSLPEHAAILLYLGRLHPKKGAHDLIAAWSAVRPHPARRARPWHLVIVGDGPAAYVAGLHRLADGAPDIHLLGPRYGEEKRAAFRAADAFVLPSLSEGQPIAVLEAWAHGLPCLLTPDCNLPEGFAARAAIRIAPGPSGIAEGLVSLFVMTPRARRDMGNAGVRLTRTRFSWPMTARSLAGVYRWLAGRACRPAWLHDSDPMRPLPVGAPITRG